MTKKKIWMIAVSAVLVLAIVISVILFVGKSEPVAVYSWDIVGFTDFYMDGGESSGLVTTDKVQSIYISKTQKVTELRVQEGQHVKKGDVLLTYDTTLSDLALERKDLDIQQKEIMLSNAEAELDKLWSMKPMVVTPPPETQPNPDKVDHTKSPIDVKKLNTHYDGDGTNKTPYYFWLGKDTPIDDGMIRFLMAEAGEPSSLYVVFQISPEDKPDTAFANEYGVKFTKVSVSPTDPSIPIDPMPTEPTKPDGTTVPTDAVQPTDATEAPQAPAAFSDPVMNTYSMMFFVPGEDSVEQGPDIDWGSGYTEAELTSMRKDKAAQIAQLEVDIKVGKAELNIMKKEASAGEVCAEFDGTVSSVLEPESAIAMDSPVVKVNGGGGFYVEGTIGEMELNNIRIGQKVLVKSWENGQAVEGEIVKIGQYPSDEQPFSYPGSLNQTYYPYRVFIDESADLKEGSYVGLSYKTQINDGGQMTVQNAFILTEGNQSYVYVKNDQGKLEKRQIQVGVSRDGMYTPVYGGVTEQDMFAFPYGKNVKEGASTFEGTEQDLYAG